MFDQQGMAHATMNFEFESIAPVSTEQDVEFGSLFITWNVRFRGMKDQSVARADDAVPQPQQSILPLPTVPRLHPVLMNTTKR